MNKRYIADLAAVALITVTAVCILCGNVERYERTHSDSTKPYVTVQAATHETHTTTGTTEAREEAASVPPVEVPEYTEMQITATAYCPCEKCCGVWATKRPLDENGAPIVYTASGTIATAGRTVAVDPSVIPYGTEIVIDGQTYVAEDCGGAIKGNRIDVYFDDHQAARQFGRQTLTAFVRG